MHGCRVNGWGGMKMMKMRSCRRYRVRHEMGSRDEVEFWGVKREGRYSRSIPVRLEGDLPGQCLAFPIEVDRDTKSDRFPLRVRAIRMVAFGALRAPIDPSAAVQKVGTKRYSHIPFVRIRIIDPTLLVDINIIKLVVVIVRRTFERRESTETALDRA